MTAKSRVKLANNCCGSAARWCGSPACPARASRPSRAPSSALHAEGRLVYVLDGDNVRHGLCADLGFSPPTAPRTSAASATSQRCSSTPACIVLTAFISPFRSDREQVRKVLGADFLEVHVDARSRSAKARPEGPLPEGARRPDPRVHRHQRALRAAGTSRPAAADRRADARRIRAGRARPAARAACSLHPRFPPMTRTR
jgi:hypothetical protein